MPNKPRLDHHNAFHHVTNRGARRDLIFLDDADRRRWITIVADVCERRGVEIHAYCLMGNHFHLLVRSQANLSDAMRDATSRYVRLFNLRHRLDGPLHKSRFDNEPVTSDIHFLRTSRYIHRNPLEASIGSLESFPWSSYPAFAGRAERPPWLCTELTLAMTGGGTQQYRRFVGEPNAADIAPPTEDAPITISTGIGHLGEILSVVAALVQVRVDDLCTGSPGVRSPGRLAVCLLAAEYGYSAESTADLLRYRNGASVRTSARRAVALLGHDWSFAALLDNARRLLDHPGEALSAAA